MVAIAVTGVVRREHPTRHRIDQKDLQDRDVAVPDVGEARDGLVDPRILRYIAVGRTRLLCSDSSTVVRHPARPGVGHPIRRDAGAAEDPAYGRVMSDAVPVPETLRATVRHRREEGAPDQAGVRWSKDAWIRWLPDHRDLLDLLPATVTREEATDAAARITDAVTAERAFIVSMIWGYGPRSAPWPAPFSGAGQPVRGLASSA